jgi:hypothetical protein
LLLEYWNRGMVAAKTDEQKKLVEECHQKTGYPHKQISVGASNVMKVPSTYDDHAVL